MGNSSSSPVAPPSPPPPPAEPLPPPPPPEPIAIPPPALSADERILFQSPSAPIGAPGMGLIRVRYIPSSPGFLRVDRRNWNWPDWQTSEMGRSELPVQYLFSTYATMTGLIGTMTLKSILDRSSDPFADFSPYRSDRNLVFGSDGFYYEMPRPFSSLYSPMWIQPMIGAGVGAASGALFSLIHRSKLTPARFVPLVQSIRVLPQMVFWSSAAWLGSWCHTPYNSDVTSVYDYSESRWTSHFGLSLLVSPNFTHAIRPYSLAFGSLCSELTAILIDRFYHGRHSQPKGTFLTNLFKQNKLQPKRVAFQNIVRGVSLRFWPVLMMEELLGATIRQEQDDWIVMEKQIIEEVQAEAAAKQAATAAVHAANVSLKK